MFASDKYSDSQLREVHHSNLTPQLLTKAPASLVGKGESNSPLLLGEGLGERSVCIACKQEPL